MFVKHLLIPVFLLVIVLGCRAEYGPPVASSWVAPPMPQSEIGQLVAQYVEVFNSGDQKALSEYVRAVATVRGPGGSNIEERVASALNFYNQTRGLDVYSVNQTNGDEVSMIVRLRLKEQWRQMDFIFEGVPKKLAGIRIVPTEPRTKSMAAASQDWKVTLDQYLQRQIDVDQFSGSILIMRDDKPLYEKAFGLADRSAKIPNTADTKFNYASVGKMFTSVAIAQLAEKGLLSFDDTLEQVLPNSSLPSASQITISDLLTHQSGFADFFEHLDHFKAVLDSKNPLEGFVEALTQLPLNFQPRSRFEYSNSNYLVLGAIIERLSKQSYEQYVQQHVFEPAGMSDTSLQRGSDVAIGYTELGEDGKLTPGVRRDSSFIAGGKGSAAGGGVTTVGDLAKFAKAMQSGELVSPETITSLLTPRVQGQRPDEHYGYGFIIRGQANAEYCGHSGGFPGVDAQFDFNRKNGTIVVVLCNYEAVGEPVARYAEELLERQ